MGPRPLVSSKILVASIGVGTMTYVLSCAQSAVANLAFVPYDGSSDANPSDSMPADIFTTDEFPVANLVAVPPDARSNDAPSGGPPSDSSSDAPTFDESPVANLVAHPG
jgi:hypothetical protein